MARHAGNEAWALATAVLSSSVVDWGTRVTRLLVAGSKRSIQVLAAESVNLLSRKFWVLGGEAIWSCVVGYWSGELDIAVACEA